MKKIIFTLFVAFVLHGCSKELIKEEEFKISTDISQNSNNAPGFKTLSSYTVENYSELEKKTQEETQKEYEIVKSTNPFNYEKNEDKNWLKRDWPFAVGILSVAAAAALIF